MNSTPLSQPKDLPTLLHYLQDWAQERPHAIGQVYKKNDQWLSITTAEYRDRVFALAVFLESKGMTAQDIGAVLSYNCPEWLHLDLAYQLLGAKSAGLYPNSTTAEIHYILNHSESTVLGVQNYDYYQKIFGEAVAQTPSASENVKRIKWCIVFNPDSFTEYAQLQKLPHGCVTYTAAIEEGRRLILEKKLKIETYLSKIDPRSGAFMIYTSGTTGNPKGALLSHDNLVFASQVIRNNWKLRYENERLFSFLPLCHIAEKLHSIGVGISCRYTVYYASAFDQVSAELPQVNPTLLLCVPRLWEKMMEGVMSKISKAATTQKTLALWALSQGEQYWGALFSGQKPSLLLTAQYHLAHRLVLAKVKKAMGLGEAYLLGSGAAPLPAHVCRWFRSLGLQILECYGLTETTGIVCGTLPGMEMAGTVGYPMPGFETQLMDDGEIATRGRQVFMGYFREQGQALFSPLEDGWFKTGDLGAKTAEGYIRIVGRKKEIMKTSGGKMIAPVPIEEKLKLSGLIAQACLVGDNRKYLSVLVTLNEDLLKEAKALESDIADKGIVTNAAIRNKINAVVETTNQSLASFEQVKKFTILSRDFSIADGEMTPTLKMKRSVIENRFKGLIDQMYV
jgi:long-chain acyl-CoA synthetase